MSNSWQSYYDNLLPEDFDLCSISARCDTDALEDFLSSMNEDEEEKYERSLVKEGTAIPSPFNHPQF